MTANIFRASQGGEVYKTEAPQADQLAPIAQRQERQARRAVDRRQRPRLLEHHHRLPRAPTPRAWAPATPPSRRTVDARDAAAQAGVGKAIDEIRAVMSRRRLRAAELPARAAELPLAGAARRREPLPRVDDTRLTVGGCPFYDADLDWARDSLVPQIAATSGRGADGRAVPDLRDAFQGREVCCHRASSHGTPAPTTSEWARFLASGVQGDWRSPCTPTATASAASATA